MVPVNSNYLYSCVLNNNALCNLIHYVFFYENFIHSFEEISNNRAAKSNNHC